MVLERGGTPFRQIFLSRNGAVVNIVYHSRNGDTAAFRQISSQYKITLYTKFGQLVFRRWEVMRNGKQREGCKGGGGELGKGRREREGGKEEEREGQVWQEERSSK